MDVIGINMDLIGIQRDLMKINMEPLGCNGEIVYEYDYEVLAFGNSTMDRPQTLKIGMSWDILG